MVARRRCVAASLVQLAVVALLAVRADAQQRRQQGINANGGQAAAPQPLDQVIMQVFDKDHDGSCSLPEVMKSLTAFAGMAGGFGDPNGGANQMEDMVNAAKNAAPTIFELLDADNSKGLTAKELVWVAKVQKGLKSGALRNLTRDVFDTVDVDADSVLSASEISAAADTEGEILPKVVALVHEALPIRKSAEELQQLLGKGAEKAVASGFSLADAIKFVDDDGDGQIDRKEAGKAFKAFKDMYLKGAKALQEMGPMLAMFGGMEDGGGGGGGLGGLEGLMGGMGGMPGGRGGGGGRGRGRGAR